MNSNISHSVLNLIEDGAIAPFDLSTIPLTISTLSVAETFWPRMSITISYRIPSGRFFCRSTACFDTLLIKPLWFFLDIIIFYFKATDISLASVRADAAFSTLRNFFTVFEGYSSNLQHSKQVLITAQWLNRYLQIILKARWIGQLGFTTVQKLEVITQPGQLIIRLITEE